MLCDTNADNHPHPCGVLRGEHFTIRHAIVNRLLARSWATVVLWSGGGGNYAHMVVKSLFLPWQFTRRALPVERRQHVLGANTWRYRGG